MSLTNNATTENHPKIIEKSGSIVDKDPSPHSLEKGVFWGVLRQRLGPLWVRVLTFRSALGTLIKILDSHLLFSCHDSRNISSCSAKRGKNFPKKLKISSCSYEISNDKCLHGIQYLLPRPRLRDHCVSRQASVLSTCLSTDRCF